MVLRPSSIAQVNCIYNFMTVGNRSGQIDNFRVTVLMISVFQAQFFIVFISIQGYVIFLLYSIRLALRYTEGVVTSKLRFQWNFGIRPLHTLDSGFCVIDIGLASLCFLNLSLMRRFWNFSYERPLIHRKSYFFQKNFF